MNLKDYTEQQIQQKITISEEDLKELLNTENDTVLDYDGIREELIEDWRINDVIVDYVDFNKLAEDDGFKKVNNDIFIRKWAFDEFCEKYRNININEMVI